MSVKTVPCVADLRRCPLCNVKIGEPFENLRDNGDDDEPTKVWTIHHYCLGIDLWISGADAEECLNHWNSLTGHRAVNAHAGLVKALIEAERFMAYFANETDGHFSGDGTPTTCLVEIRAALAAAGVKP